MRELQNWVLDPSTSDQDPERKSAYLLTGKYEKTRMRAVGKSNGILKRKAKEVFRDKAPLDEIRDWVIGTFAGTDIYELRMLLLYLLDLYSEEYTPDLWKEIIARWLPLVDYWAIADHLCLNVFKHFPIKEQFYHEDLLAMRSSGNYWYRRLSITAYVAIVRDDASYIPLVREGLDALVGDRNYYIQKAIPWLVRESTRKHSDQHLMKEFMESHRNEFPPSVYRDACKYFR